MEVRNPFRQRDRKRHFDGMVKAYLTKHKNLVRADGSRHNGNSWATYFWRGYDDSIPARAWDASSKEMMAYVTYCAGRAVAKAEGKS
jgi:hypothetical protein